MQYENHVLEISRTHFIFHLSSNLYAFLQTKNLPFMLQQTYMQTSNYIMERFDMAKSTPLGKRGLNKNVFTQKRGALKINQFIIHGEKCLAQQKRLYGAERFIILQLFCTVTVFILELNLDPRASYIRCQVKSLLRLTTTTRKNHFFGKC